MILALPARAVEIADAVRPCVPEWRPRYQLALEVAAVAFWMLEEAWVLRAESAAEGEVPGWVDTSVERWEGRAREIAADMLVDFDEVARLVLGGDAP